MRRSCGMSVSSSSLPAGFDALTPFVDFWAADTAAGRAHCRDVRDDLARLGFYNAMVGQVHAALAYLDAKPVRQYDEAEQRLMKDRQSVAVAQQCSVVLGHGCASDYEKRKKRNTT